MSKILIVEDDPEIAMLERDYLEIEGFETQVAKDGGKGVELFRSFQPDLVLLDIKQIDEKEHIKLTGHTNRNILAMAQELSDMGKPVWIRHVLVPGGSDKDEYLHRLADFIHTLKNVERVEVLPYHTLGTFKWEKLGIPYPLEGVKPPTQERIDNARKILGAI